MTSSNAEVLIVGAGPTGLVLALALQRAGASFRIIDRADAPGTTSRALAVQARTLEFYRQFGIADDVIEAGVKLSEVDLWAKGNQLARLPLTEIGTGLSPFPFALVYPQDEHERLLIRRLEDLGVHVERGRELISITQNANGVIAQVDNGTGSPERIETKFLAGCDGASSRTRELLDIEFPGGTYEGLFYVADVEVDRDQPSDRLQVDIESTDFLMVFPLKKPGHVRLVGTIKHIESDSQQVAFDDVGKQARAHLGLAVQKVNWFSTYKVHHRVASRFRDGRIFLLGDAAHIHSPVGGQGMNTGIGDSINLSWKLAGVLSGNYGEDILDTYHHERRAFAQSLVATTDRVFAIVTHKGWFAEMVRTRIAPVMLSILMRWEVFRRTAFRIASQIGVRYLDSTISDGRAGRVAAGDRLPWVASCDNFAPLQSFSWQVHVYGLAKPEVMEVCRELDLKLYQFPWSEDAERAGLHRNAVYAVRPDGYVGFADGCASADYLRKYVETHFRAP